MTNYDTLTIPQRLRVWAAAGGQVTLTAKQCRDLAEGMEATERGVYDLSDKAAMLMRRLRITLIVCAVTAMLCVAAIVVVLL